MKKVDEKHGDLRIRQGTPGIQFFVEEFLTKPEYENRGTWFHVKAFLEISLAEDFMKEYKTP